MVIVVGLLFIGLFAVLVLGVLYAMGRLKF